MLQRAICSQRICQGSQGQAGGPAASSASTVAGHWNLGWWLGVHLGTAARRLLWRHVVPLFAPEVCTQSGTSTLLTFLHGGEMCSGGTTSRMKVAPRCYCSSIFSNAVTVGSTSQNCFVNFSIHLHLSLALDFCLQFSI